jgi:hypothetical protein
VSFFGRPNPEEVAIQLIEGLENGTLVLDEPGEDTSTPEMVAGEPGSDSDEYTVTLRCRMIVAIAQHLRELAALGGDERFLFAVDAAIKKTEESLQEFADLKREGNTREILRTLLNTMRNGGWERFRNPVVPTKLQEFLTQLATAEWIIPEQVEEFHSLIEDQGLDSLALPLEQWPE